MVKNKFLIFGCIVLAGLLLFENYSCTLRGNQPVIICCSENNDLFRTLEGNNIPCIRFETPGEAIDHAGEGSGVMILADEYPQKPTFLDASHYEKAKTKDLRLYVEYPSFLPGINAGMPEGTYWERAVISSGVFAPALNKLRILAIHDCHYIPVEAENPDIVVARVAGLDSAVYGLPEVTRPLLFKIPYSGKTGSGIMVSATKLSQFITARYAPKDAWQVIWKHIFAWLNPGENTIELEWVQSVRPGFSKEEPLPEDFEQEALKKGIDWYFNSRMIMNSDMLDKYNLPANDPAPASADPDLSVSWPFGHRVGLMPDLDSPEGDGSFGVLEGFDAKIFYNGNQPVRWWRRNDCNGESAGAIGLAGKMLQNKKYINASGNIANWLYFNSEMSTGDRIDTGHPAYGLFGWNDVPEYAGAGSMDGFAVYYGDDNARSMLGMMAAAAALETSRYNKRITEGLLGNLRVSGIYGFQPNRIDQGFLINEGWEHFFLQENVSYSPHYQANLWACYIWAWHHTGLDLFLERAKTAITMTMEAYPDNWVWTNGIQQERAKMLLPLAWLIRAEDTPEHREWLRLIAGDLLKEQHETGAIPESLGEKGKGGFPPPPSNEAYGTSETPLIQSNDDNVSDLLYTTAFAFLGLHEAAAATGDSCYRNAEDKLAEFLCRIQIQSGTHPELDGGWFRAFDIDRWEYWASNADAGWGAWCIESGWSQSWITAVMALRQMDISLWQITSGIDISEPYDGLREIMIPDNMLHRVSSGSIGKR
jgi:hypothetical protein